MATVAAGATLGPYEIQRAIDAGGIGNVWKGRDLTLHREVAIRVLPST